MFLLVCFPHYALNELVSSPMNNDVVNSVSFIKMTRKKKIFFFFNYSFTSTTMCTCVNLTLTVTYLSINNGSARLLIIYKISDNTMSQTTQCLRKHKVSENTNYHTVQVLDSTP